MTGLHLTDIAPVHEVDPAHRALCSGLVAQEPGSVPLLRESQRLPPLGHHLLPGLEALQVTLQLLTEFVVTVQTPPELSKPVSVFVEVNVDMAGAINMSAPGQEFPGRWENRVSPPDWRRSRVRVLLSRAAVCTHHSFGIDIF